MLYSKRKCRFWDGDLSFQQGKRVCHVYGSGWGKEEEGWEGWVGG